MRRPGAEASVRGLLRTLGFWAQVAFVLAYVGILSTAMFVFQFGLGEFPCPLCITQRMGMIVATLGAVFILVQALRGTLDMRGYTTGLGMSLLGAILGAAMSVRQVLLHIEPGDLGYGTAVFGKHLYTWALVTFIVVAVFVGALLLGSDAFFPIAPRSAALRVIVWILVWAFVATIAVNLVVVFVELGFNWFLPDNPTRYELLYQIGIRR
jgi:disulfide bond formation protein DsbB